MITWIQMVLGAVISALFFPTAELLRNQVSDRKLFRAVEIYNELNATPELEESRKHLEQYIEHTTLSVFQFGPERKWLRIINILRGVTCVSMLVLALVVANDIHPQLLWFSMYVLSGLFFGGLFVWDRKSPQSYDTEQDSVEVGDETPSLLKSPEQTSDEDVDR